MSPAARDVPAVLARHGIAPDADAATLLAALEARGWEARLEELPAPRPPPAAPLGAGHWPCRRTRATGPTATCKEAAGHRRWRWAGCWQRCWSGRGRPRRWGRWRGG